MKIPLKDGYAVLPSDWRPIDVCPLRKSTYIHVVGINENTPYFFFGDNSAEVSKATEKYVYEKISKENPWFTFHIDPIRTMVGQTVAPAGIHTLKDAEIYAEDTFYPYDAKIYRVKPLRNYLLVRPMIIMEKMTRKLSDLIFEK